MPCKDKDLNPGFGILCFAIRFRNQLSTGVEGGDHLKRFDQKRTQPFGILKMASNAMTNGNLLK